MDTMDELANTNEMTALFTWRVTVAERLPEMLSRVFALRGINQKGPVSTENLETCFAWHLIQVYSRENATVGDIDLEKQSFDNLTVALAKAEWSASNRAADPEATGAPWGPTGTPWERLKVQTDAFERWVVDTAEHTKSFIDGANQKMDEHGPGTFAELFIDSLHDFKTHIVMRALGNEFYSNTALAANCLNRTDEWFHELRSSVRHRDLAAMIYDRGGNSLINIMDKIAQPVAQPGI